MSEPLRLGNRIILTIGRAVDRYRELYGVRNRKQMQTTIARLGVREVLVEDATGELAPVIDARTPVYYQSDLDKALRERPGRGANLRGRGRPRVTRA